MNEPYWHSWPADLVFELIEAEEEGDEERAKTVHEVAEVRTLPEVTNTNQQGGEL